MTRVVPVCGEWSSYWNEGGPRIRMRVVPLLGQGWSPYWDKGSTPIRTGVVPLLGQGWSPNWDNGGTQIRIMMVSLFWTRVHPLSGHVSNLNFQNTNRKTYPFRQDIYLQFEAWNTLEVPVDEKKQIIIISRSDSLNQLNESTALY